MQMQEKPAIKDKLTALLRICAEPNCVNISSNATASLVLASANQQQ